MMKYRLTSIILPLNVTIPFFRDGFTKWFTDEINRIYYWVLFWKAYNYLCDLYSL